MNSRQVGVVLGVLIAIAVAGLVVRVEKGEGERSRQEGNQIQRVARPHGAPQAVTGRRA